MPSPSSVEWCSSGACVEQLDGNRALRVDGLWFSYCRMLSVPTLLCGSMATALDHLLCSLRDTPAHWAETVLLNAISVVFAVVLLMANMSGGRWLAILCAIVVTLCGGIASCCNLCAAHQAFAWTIVGIGLCTLLALWKDRSVQSCSLRGDIPESSPLQPSDSCAASSCLASEINDLQTLLNALQAPSLGPNADTAESICIVDCPTTDTVKPAWARYAVAVVVISITVTYMIVVPTVGLIVDWLTPQTATSQKMTEMTFAESLRLHTVSGVVMLMFLAAGASIGSFLNVVIYRLPRRRPLFWPPSACPNCKTRLAGKDNIPILGWLMLGGRCRYCNIAISARYPMIETVVAAFFVLFYFRELLSGGVNLPLRTPNFYHGVVWILFYTKWDLVSIYGFHMILLVILLAWGMINYDRFRVPAIAITTTLGFAILLPAFFPHLNPALAGWKSSPVSLPWPVAGPLLYCLLGCLGGALVGLSLDALLSMRSGEEPAVVSLNDTASEVTSIDSTAELSALHLCVESASAPISVATNGTAERTDFTAAEFSSSQPLTKADLYGTQSTIPSSRSNAAASLALVGAALGVESAIAIGAIALLLHLGLLLLRFGTAKWRATKPRPIPITLLFFVTAIGYLSFWDQAYNFTRRLRPSPTTASSHAQQGSGRVVARIAKDAAR